MKKLLFVLLLCTFPVLSWAGCVYGDDPRMESDVRGLIKSIQSGQETSPIRMTLGTYLGMSPKTRAAFGELITITSKACNPVSVFDGEVIGRVTIPFEEYYRTLSRAIRKDRRDIFVGLKKNARVAPMSVEAYVDLFGKLPFLRTGGLKVRNRMKQLFPDAGKLKPEEDWLEDPTIHGRMEDYTMARLYYIWGGSIVLNKGCGPYELPKQFVSKVSQKDMFGTLRVRVVVQKYKPSMMMRVMGSDIDFYSRSEVAKFKIKGCTP
ncbi:MAG: hypothetical protein Q9N67_01770 [Ghiorsea sp.]|nr:hypothetical protein [Ghiorsea sp.]